MLEIACTDASRSSLISPLHRCTSGPVKMEYLVTGTQLVRSGLILVMEVRKTGLNDHY